MEPLTHLDDRGQVRMVDISAKPTQAREAVAQGELQLRTGTLELLERQALSKGDALATARVAGIMAAKKTADLIPLCHPLALTHCAVEFEVPASRDRILITARAAVAGRTGVEMEALTAVTGAALTLYDMCKAVDRTMSITNVRLMSKTKQSV